jgi:hypothetical protein
MWDVADDVLLAAFAVGDADAASVFVRRYQRRVFGLARSIVDDRELAEDLAQEAFVRAWQQTRPRPVVINDAAVGAFVTGGADLLGRFNLDQLLQHQRDGVADQIDPVTDAERL